MTIIIAFSINVASVMGSLRAVPKHAQVIAFLSSNVFVTPAVVILNIITVASSAMEI